MPAEPAYDSCLALMAELESEGRIDLNQSCQKRDPNFSTDYLFGPARGKMFGVMVAQAPGGGKVELRAFSGQYNGVWQVPGWVDPVFDLDGFHRVHDVREREIKELGRKIEDLPAASRQQLELISLRKQMSRQLMVDIHDLYRLKNFRGQEAGLRQIFPANTGVPTGTR